MTSTDQLMKRTLMVGSPFDLAYGLELLECRQRFARARVRITDSLSGRDGRIHGGMLSALAEGLASGATNWSTRPRGKIGMGMSNSTSILDMPKGEWIYATARSAHAEGDFWVWDIESRDEGDRLCALSRVHIAVRPHPVASPLVDT